MYAASHNGTRSLPHLPPSDPRGVTTDSGGGLPKGLASTLSLPRLTGAGTSGSLWHMSTTTLRANKSKLPMLALDQSPVLTCRELSEAEERELKAVRAAKTAISNFRAGKPVRPPPGSFPEAGQPNRFRDTFRTSATAGFRDSAPGGFRATGMTTGMSSAADAAREVARQERLRQLPKPPKYRKVTASDRRNNSQSALNADLDYQRRRLAEVAESPRQKEARFAELKHHRWSTIFEPIEDARSLLPLRFGGRLPLLNTDSPDPEPTGEKVPAFTFEEAEAIVECCSAFQRLGMQETDVPNPLVLTRSPFCRLICAAAGLQMTPGGPTWLTKAAMHFDGRACKIYMNSPAGSGSATLGTPYSFGFSLVYATTAQSKLPELLELPVCKLFGRLLLHMMEDVQNVGCGDAEERTLKENKAKERLFEKLLPRAMEHVRERASYVRMQMRNGGPPRTPDGRERATTELAPVVEGRERTGSSNATSPRSPPRSPLKESTSEKPPRTPTSGAPTSEDRKKEGKAKAAVVDIMAVVHEESDDPLPEEPKRKYDSEAPSETGDESTVLYTRTFAVLKGELLLNQLMEPEVLHFVAEFGDMFRKIFDVYCDVPVNGSDGHMSLIGLLRVCDNFGLFPTIADFKTIQWLYDTAEGWINVSSLQGYSRQRRPSTEGVVSAGSQPQAAGKKRPGPRRGSTSSRGNAEPRGGGFLFFGKWLKQHLAWLTKDFGSMPPSELQAACTLWAMSEWMEFRKLRVRDFFCLLDRDNTGVVTLEELQIGVDFMAFDDPPSPEDVATLMRLIIPPSATFGGAQVKEEDSLLQVETTILEMALMAVSKQREHRVRAANCFLKDFNKMSKPESKACIFFGQLWNYLEDKNWTPDQLFNELDLNSNDEISQTELASIISRMMRTSTRPMAACSVDSPFELLDTNQDGLVSRHEFCGVLEKVRQARELKKLNDKVKHPIFLSATSGGNLPMVSKTRIFGPHAFVECLLKIAMIHLTYHWNSAQAEQPSFVKGMWLLVFMHQHYKTAKVNAEKSAEAEASSGTTFSSLNAVQDSQTNRWPKCSMSMQKLLRQYPRLFSDAPEVPPALAVLLPPASARPGSRARPGARPGSQSGPEGGSSRPASRLGFGAAQRPGTQEALYRTGWGKLADAALQRVYGVEDEDGPAAVGISSLERAMISVTATGRF